MRDIRGSFSQPRQGNHIISQTDSEKIKKIFEGDMKILNEYCKELGIELARKGVSNSHLRSILDEIQEIFRKEFQEKPDEFKIRLMNRLELLKPKLAYLVGKQKGGTKEALGKLYLILDFAISKVSHNNSEYLKNFMEAIVAYHRYYEKGGGQ
ncbi:MAG: type III-A CRISPR-associated protein Csm2 [Candidatus Aminicenantes bacterium]|nr:type III-A CRISPR-associated protein Csm2 [Candidatus Aminicenantes bacterium]